MVRHSGKYPVHKMEDFSVALGKTGKEKKGDVTLKKTV